MAKKKIYVVESCDGEEAQIFEDWVPAEAADAAVAEVVKLRGEYAVVCETRTLAEHLKLLNRRIGELRSYRANGPRAWQKGWDKHIEEEGELVRVDGKLLKLDGEEADRCELCGKVFEPSGDTWGGVDPECADKISAYMDKHENVDQEAAIEALKAKCKR
jgi:hypothetical protein